MVIFVFIASSGMLRGVLEVERAFEMLAFGALYKYSSTAFVTFNSRVTEAIAQQVIMKSCTVRQRSYI